MSLTPDLIGYIISFLDFPNNLVARLINKEIKSYFIYIEEFIHNAYNKPISNKDILRYNKPFFVLVDGITNEMRMCEYNGNYCYEEFHQIDDCKYFIMINLEKLTISYNITITPENDINDGIIKCYDDTYKSIDQLLEIVESELYLYDKTFYYDPFIRSYIISRRLLDYNKKLSVDDLVKLDTKDMGKGLLDIYEEAIIKSNYNI